MRKFEYIENWIRLYLISTGLLEDYNKFVLVVKFLKWKFMFLSPFQTVLKPNKTKLLLVLNYFSAFWPPTTPMDQISSQDTIEQGFFFIFTKCFQASVHISLASFCHVNGKFSEKKVLRSSPLETISNIHVSICCKI